MKRVAALALVLALGGGVAGCSPVIENHGYAPDQTLLAEITVGQDTRDSVRRKIGRPGTTGAFNDQGWYYVSTTVERYTYHEPKVVDRHIVAVEFDDNNLVASVNTYGVEDGRVIDLATKTTPTHGRQLTVLQQLFGNFGRITGEDIAATQ